LITSVGNLVFYKSYGPDAYHQALTRLVQWGTHGPFVHVAIVVDDNKKLIEASTKGIAYSALPKDMTAYTMVQTATVNKDANGKIIPLDPERLARAVEWAQSQINAGYGFLDIVTQGIDILAPWNMLQISQAGTYDCSNFAAAFLDKAGVWLPDNFKEPFNVSPNDLAEWYGLLPARQRVR
jgi:hypothetical protein